MSPRGVILLAVMAGVLGGPSSGAAYTGGPDLVEILGWDSTTERVYFHTIPRDESLELGGTFYFDFRSRNPWKRQRAPWSRVGANFDDSLQNAKLRSLKARLKPMPPEPASVFSWSRRNIVSSDALRLPFDRVRRFVVRVSPQNGPEFQVVAYGRPDAAVKDIYPIPGRETRIYVLAFFGNPFDGIAETQVPAVGLPRVQRIEWSRER